MIRRLSFIFMQPPYRRLIQTFGADTLPVVAVAGGMRFQSIDVGEVANHLGSVFAPLV